MNNKKNKLSRTKEALLKSYNDSSFIKTYVTQGQDKCIKNLIYKRHEGNNASVLDDLFLSLFYITFSSLEATDYKSMKDKLLNQKVIYLVSWRN